MQADHSAKTMGIGAPPGEEFVPTKPWPFPKAAGAVERITSFNPDPSDVATYQSAEDFQLTWKVAPQLGVLTIAKPEYTTVRIHFTQAQIEQMHGEMSKHRADFSDDEHADFSFRLDDEVTRLSYDELKLALRYFREKKAVAIDS